MTPSSASSVVGAGYIDAVLTGAEDLIIAYRLSFTSDELLDALTGPMRTVGRYLSYRCGCTVAEASDALVNAYLRMSIEPNPTPPGDVLL